MNIKIVIYTVLAAVLALSFIWSTGYIIYKHATYSLTTDDNKTPKLLTLARVLLFLSVMTIIVISIAGIFIDMRTLN